MKKVLLSLAAVIAIVAIFAQNPVAKNQTQINAGVGLSSWGVPVYLGFDHGVHKDITMGMELSYRAYRDDDKDHDDYRHNVIGISGNANYHFNHILNIPRNWDFYAGLNLGFYIWNSPYNYHGNHTSGLGLGSDWGTLLFHQFGGHKPRSGWKQRLQQRETGSFV